QRLCKTLLHRPTGGGAAASPREHHIPPFEGREGGALQSGRANQDQRRRAGTAEGGAQSLIRIRYIRLIRNLLRVLRKRYKTNRRNTWNALTQPSAEWKPQPKG